MTWKPGKPTKPAMAEAMLEFDRRRVQRIIAHLGTIGAEIELEEKGPRTDTSRLSVLRSQSLEAYELPEEMKDARRTP